jgi:hypothetical protein
MERPKFINPIERAMDPAKRDKYLEEFEGKILVYTDKDGYITEQITVDELREKFNGDEDSFLLNAERLDSGNTDHVKGNVLWVDKDFDIEKANKSVARSK